MEKAKLTQEQAAAIDAAVSYTNKETLIRTHRQYIEDGLKWTDADFISLNELDNQTVKLALENGYEVIEANQTITVTEEMRQEIFGIYDDDGGHELYDEGYHDGVREVLDKLGIKIAGINDEEESL